MLHSMYYFKSLSSQKHLMKKTLCPILWMKKLRPKELKWLISGRDKIQTGWLFPEPELTINPPML